MEKLLVPIARSDWEKNYAKTATPWFDKHEIRSSSSDRWYFRRADSTEYAAEIAILRFNCILVHGDLPDVMYFGGPSAGMDKLVWLADSHLHYISSKTRLGERHQWVAEVALDEFNDHIEQLEENSLPVREALRDLRHALEFGATDEHDFRQRLYDASDGDAELMFGEVTSTDVILTQLAAKKLVELLKKVPT